MSRPPVPGFTPASALPRTTPAEAAPSKPTTAFTASNRNASNAHLPIPSAPPITLSVEKNNEGEPMQVSSSATVGLDGKAAPAPGTNVNGVEAGATAVKAPEKTNKPVNVPSGSKRSIVVNARQVSLCFRHGHGGDYRQKLIEGPVLSWLQLRILNREAIQCSKRYKASGGSMEISYRIIK
ncbi:hypothetical protein QFC19_008452 [Naganishia cerealis]|uniref:Uncharacterized protein n=1 Tax=Naganishia cerealis TaxID=610337 RepID=A0ACC2V2J8_9TREE|nr:hypothetical protein QFC19_008452 [Naganishia cerealis]